MLRYSGSARLTRVVVCLVASAAVMLFGMAPAAARPLRIYHIDVNQADATLIVSPSGHTMLVDCGGEGQGSWVKAVMGDAGVSDLDYFLLTHYHKDHAGGIDELVGAEGVEVGTAYDRGDKDFLDAERLDDAFYMNYQNALGEDAEVLRRGESVDLDPDMTVTCVAHGTAVLGEEDPIDYGSNENDMSVALLVQYGPFRYFMGGDLEEHTESKIAARDLVMDVDVYRADHHGSDTSSSEDFMSDLRPSLVVISNGDHGVYKHPRQSVLDAFAAMEPRPIVLQTNRYTKGGSGGNVADRFIADMDPSGPEGSILVTVEEGGASYQVSYADTSFTLMTRQRDGVPPEPPVVIASLTPDPPGADRDLEDVTLRNRSSGAVSLVGWTLADESGGVWTLNAVGDLAPGDTATVVRSGMTMSLNNSGDHIYLRDPDAKVVDDWAYVGSSEGVTIRTGK
jgi:beta-lactamase superfamily II metal-dependent hydrolase